MIYKFNIEVSTDAELSDELLIELSIEMRAAFLSLLKSKRISGKMEGTIDVRRADRNQTYTGEYVQ